MAATTRGWRHGRVTGSAVQELGRSQPFTVRTQAIGVGVRRFGAADPSTLYDATPTQTNRSVMPKIERMKNRNWGERFRRGRARDPHTRRAAHRCTMMRIATV
jgi:hypothetical protein